MFVPAHSSSFPFPSVWFFFFFSLPLSFLIIFQNRDKLSTAQSDATIESLGLSNIKEVQEMEDDEVATAVEREMIKVAMTVLQGEGFAVSVAHWIFWKKKKYSFAWCDIVEWYQ